MKQMGGGGGAERVWGGRRKERIHLESVGDSFPLCSMYTNKE
jgi:hypothetical protein